ncbi:MAG TPA: Dna2/Cas4 domain-containing protein [Methanoregulaceae archaeon]|nr:Dna2/Cas4 domain-containing protein [Methanoregulaceae archaeon]
MRPELSISSVVTASICPLLFYLDHKDEQMNSSRYEICKQISYHLGDRLDTAVIWEELKAVHPDMDDSNLPYLEQCLDMCRDYKGWRSIIETDLAVKSNKFGIYGVVDKVFEDSPRFSIVRSVRAPPAGIYVQDRLRVFGYILCLQEMTGEDIQGGAVEYIPSGISRPCIPQPIDKRRFLRALDQAREVSNGKIPKKPISPPCDNCRVAGRCIPGGKRLSDLF